jgi:TolA-binding protein
MRKLTLLIVILLPLLGIAKDEENALFQGNLKEMLTRTDQSIKILREQIVENQTAPFLPDLYLQLAELQAQRANVLYYNQMERENKSESSVKTVDGSKQFSPVTEAMQEAISTLRMITKDFKQYNKSKKVYYLLAVSLKSIDEIPEFIKTVRQLVQDYPNTQEAMRARLLLGQHFFDKQTYKDAADQFRPIANIEFPYERNLARYRLGLIALSAEKFTESLQYFEQVVTDEELKEEDSETTLSLKTKQVTSNLKREALIDSVRAYTSVFKNPDANPVAYYSKIAPTENLFQEVMEKLALRYVSIKKYETAIKLLRTMSERISDPEKVINIYQEVLLLIPIKDRVDLPAAELRYVLEKYNDWLSFYVIPPAVKSASYAFFEKQIRDLGTRSHEMAKIEKVPANVSLYRNRAKDFYLLYLAFYKNTKHAAKIAVNLADVYFAADQFNHSGEYYLRVFLGEYGVPSNNKEELIKNAILCAEKKATYGFYDQVRVRGLLINAIEKYMAFSREKAGDPKLNFALAKAKYEQGFYDVALNDLIVFMKKFPTSSHAADAGNIVLDYYNTRNDFEGLVASADKMLQIPLADKSYLAKVRDIRGKGDNRRLAEAVKTSTDYDVFEQGKSYLKMAESTPERGLASLALKTALAKSRQEKDLDTYLKSAAVMAEKESNPLERSKIWQSVIAENVRVTRYHQARELLEKISSDPNRTLQDRVTAFGEEVDIALSLRDWNALAGHLKNPMWNRLPTATRAMVERQLMAVFQAPVEAPSDLARVFENSRLSAASLNTLYKAQNRVPSSLREKVDRESSALCGAKGTRQAVCHWRDVSRFDVARVRFVESLKAAPLSPEAIEPYANQFLSMTQSYAKLEGSGDPHLDIVLSLRSYELYTAFARYLERVAQATPALGQVLKQKSAESMGNGKAYLEKCKKIIKAASVITPANKYCYAGQNPPLTQLVDWKNIGDTEKVKSDPDDDETIALQSRVFGDAKSGEALLDLSFRYYREEKFNHAAASAEFGMSQYKESGKDFKAVLGCSLTKLHLLNEGVYHLNTANNYQGLRDKCLAEVRSFEQGS